MFGFDEAPDNDNEGSGFLYIKDSKVKSLSYSMCKSVVHPFEASRTERISLVALSFVVA